MMATDTARSDAPLPLPEPRRKEPTASDVMACIKRMGGTRFSPVPTLLHRVLTVLKRCPEVLKLLGWMFDHTVAYPTLCHYAVAIVQKGKKEVMVEMHIEHAAKDLGMDEANARRAWRHGCRMGLWGNKPLQDSGDTYQGKRRLYLYADVDLDRAAAEFEHPEPIPQTDEDYEKVCADFFGGPIWKQIKDRPKNTIENWMAEDKRRHEVQTDAWSDFDAAFRAVITQEEDTVWLGRGVKPNHQEHKFKNGHAAAHALRKELVSSFYLPALRVTILEGLEKRSAQTSSDCAQSQPESSRKVDSKPCAEPVSLLPERGQEKPRGLGDTTTDKRTYGSSATHPVEGRADRGYLHAGRKQQAGTEKPDAWVEYGNLTPDEKAAVNYFLTKTAEFQNCFPRTRFGVPLVSLDDKGDVGLALRILRTLKALPHESILTEMTNFMWDTGEWLGALPGAMGKLPRAEDSVPGKQPNERILNLFASRAEKWVAGYADRQARLQKQRDDKARREDRLRHHAEERERAAAVSAEVDREFPLLPADRLAQLRAQAEANIKANPNAAQAYWRMSTEQRRDLVESTAKKIYRDTLEVNS